MEGEINCISNTEEKYISFTKVIIVDKFETKNIITEKQFKSLCKENIIEYEEFTDSSAEGEKDLKLLKYKIKEMINVKNKLDLLMVLNLCNKV